MSLPTLKDLGVFYHSNVMRAIDCTGILEVEEAFGECIEDGIKYAQAWVVLKCTDPGCHYPLVAMPNPNRYELGPVDSHSKKIAGDWRRRSGK